MASSLYAASYEVNSTADEPDANVRDGQCETAAGSCTLRAAVMQANETSGVDEIVIPPGNYPLRIGNLSPSLRPPEVNAAAGDLDITDSVTIRGGNPADPNDTRISFLNPNATVRDRIFQISPNPTGPAANRTFSVTIEGVTLENGYQPGEMHGGGAILVDAEQVMGPSFVGPPQITIRNVVFRNNYSLITGGAIANWGADVVIEDTVMDGNQADYTPSSAAGFQQGFQGPNAVGILFDSGGQGGGVANWTGDMVLRRTVIKNGLAQTGGGIFAQDSGVRPSLVHAEDSVISGNLAFMGGGIFTMARGLWDFPARVLTTHGVVLDSVTVESNIAEFAGGGIYTSGATMISNSTFSLNEAWDAPGNPRYPGRGGGIFNSGRVLDIQSSTIAGNEAEEPRVTEATTEESTGGDEIFLDFTNSEVSPGVLRSDYRFAIQNSFIGDGPPNDPSDPGFGVDDNCNGPIGYQAFIESLGTNLDSGSTCFAQSQSLARSLTALKTASPTDLVSPSYTGLAPLAENGGLERLPDGSFAKTRKLLTNSPARDAGNGCPGSDQRQFKRLNGCDIGAYQVDVNTAESGNAAPVLQPDLASTEGATVRVKVTLNDTDPDVSDDVVLSSIEPPIIGSATTVGGAIKYDPPQDFSGPFPAEVAVKYTATDGKATSVGTFTVMVYAPGQNTNPTGDADTLTIPQGSDAKIDVLANDTDPDFGDTLHVVAFEAFEVPGGKISLDQDGTIAFTPSVPALTGIVEFTYDVGDNRGGITQRVPVTLTINGVPVVENANQTLDVEVGEVVEGSIAAMDPEGDPLVFFSSDGLQGAVEIDQSTGTFTYTPDSDADTTVDDSFTVGVYDTVGRGVHREEIVVNLAVKAALDPVADSSVTVGENNDTNNSATNGGNVSSTPQDDDSSNLTISGGDGGGGAFGAMLVIALFAFGLGKFARIRGTAHRQG